MKSPHKQYDLIVVGAGITGASLVYVAAKYTNISRIALIDKREYPGEGVSNLKNNSQTLHFGDIETNYTLEKARRVKRHANMTRLYLDRYDPHKRLHTVYHKMAFGVGQEEVAALERRYEEFKKLFPDLRKVYRDELSEVEPKIVEGRDPHEPIMALYSPNGYTVDYGRLAEDFVKRARLETDTVIDTYFNEEVKRIRKTDGGFDVMIDGRRLRGRVVEVAAGAFSLYQAHTMGYGKHWTLVPVAGNFYYTPHVVSGKIYRVQIEGLPFAAAHGDPDVHDPSKTRFGPTAKVVFMLERGDYSTVWKFLRLFGCKPKTILALLSILFNPIYFKFMIKNIAYGIPYFGKRLFLPQVQAIVPSLEARDLELTRGGIRPQIIDVEKRDTVLGEGKLYEDSIIFNVTPSPGASVALGSAEDDMFKVIEMFGEGYEYDHDRLCADLEEVPERIEKEEKERVESGK